jgi:hypothetical protein
VPNRRRDELAQIAPAVEVAGEGDDFETFHHKLRAQQQLQTQFFGLNVCPHHASHRTFIGDGQRRITQSMGTCHQLLRLRGATLEAEIAEAMQLAISRLHAGHRARTNTG